jgi:nitrate/nitrite transport system permease protein
LKCDGGAQRDNAVRAASPTEIALMSIPVLKSDFASAVPTPSAVPATTAAPAPRAEVLRLKLPKPSLVQSRLLPFLSFAAARVLPPLVMLGLILGVWQILCMKPGATLPSPSKIWTEAYDLIVDPFFVAGPQDIGLGWRVLTSLQRVAIGYGFAGIIGILLGTIIGQSVWAMRGLDPIFQVLRTISPLAWLPISLAAFRDSQPSAIFVIFITSVWPIIINTAVGIRNIPQDYRNVAAVLRLNHLEFFWKIMIPSAAPYIFTGLRIGIGLSWLAIVAAEMLTGGVGIGFFIWDAWNSSRLSDIVVALVYIGLIGFLLDRLVAAAATFITHGTAAN